MRSALATVLLVVFATVITFDGVCCADGCTHEMTSASGHSLPESPDGICKLCAGGIDSSVQADFGPGAVVAAPVRHLSRAQCRDAHTGPLEHPPRF